MCVVPKKEILNRARSVVELRYMEITQEQIDRNRQRPKDEPCKGAPPINTDALLSEDEDENTVAKSIIDEIIEETESSPSHPTAVSH